MKQMNLLDQALLAYLEALNDPIVFTDWPAAKQAARRALIRWDNALFSAGVYRLAAQGEAAIWAESATITEDQWTAFTLAILLTRLPSYNADVFLKLSQAKTFEDRKAIRKEAGNGVHSLKELKKWHLHVAKQYGKKVIEEEDRELDKKFKLAMIKLEADREFDKKFKLAMIKLEADISAIAAKMAQQAAPAAKQAARAKERAKPFSANALQEFARLWNAARERLGMPPLVRNFLAENKERLRAIGVESQTDVKRIKDAARKAGLIPRWHKRKSSGKKRQA